MSSSREDSPDWLHCFRAPNSSTVVLSSNSEHSRDASPTKEDGTESEEVSLSKSPKLEEEDDENLGKILGESGAKSASSKKSSLKSLKKGSKLGGDDIPLEKNESDKPKKRKGEDG
ncbi:uncharacterized protein LOC112094990, partial [Morus notabilis]|uniref:uncharacterized protein LOC112094990 n=1 Tax=Morus notabilis TaxID=981085 RepID=UPI000CED46E6